MMREEQGVLIPSDAQSGAYPQMRHLLLTLHNKLNKLSSAALMAQSHPQTQSQQDVGSEELGAFLRQVQKGLTNHEILEGQNTVKLRSITDPKERQKIENDIAFQRAAQSYTDQYYEIVKKAAADHIFGTATPEELKRQRELEKQLETATSESVRRAASDQLRRLQDLYEQETQFGAKRILKC